MRKPYNPAITIPGLEDDPLSMQFKQDALVSNYLPEEDAPMEAEAPVEAPVKQPKAPSSTKLPSLAALLSGGRSPQIEPEAPEAPKAPLLAQSEQDPEAYAQALAEAREQEKYAAMQQATNALLAGAGRYSGAKDVTGAANEANKAAVALARGKAEDMTAKEKFKQVQSEGKTKAAQAKREGDDLDPNSDASKSFRQMLESVAPDIAAQYKANGLFDKIAAGDYDKIYNPLALRENIKSREQMAKDNALARKELQAEKLAAKKDNEPMTAGIRELDKQFAKDYNDWTGSGKAAFDKSLSRLKEARKNLVQQQVGGRFQGELPDWAKPEALKVIRDDVHASAVTALKAALGSQFTEREGTRIQGYSFNEKLSPAENLKKIDLAIKELEDAKINKEAKVRQFEAKGTLGGFRSEAQEEERVEVISPDGEEGDLPRSQVDAALKKGFRLK
jgi:hypothetical protein